MMACNGFSMFANHSRARLEAQRGRKFHGGMHELIEACTPLWKDLAEEERKKWKDIARNYKKTEEYSERKRALRHQRRDNRPTNSQGLPLPTPKPLTQETQEDNEDDIDSEEDPGVPMYRNTANPWDAGHSLTIRLEDNDYPHLQADGSVRDMGRRAMDEKKQKDKEKIRDFFANESGGTLVDVKRCRFLLVCMQTYGRLEEGVCVPAEVGIVEWSLAVGIMDEYLAVLGPWEMKDETLRERAFFHAQHTHRIPLEGPEETQDFTTHRRRVLRELLGRAEPGIAANQGVKVGLYKEGLTEVDHVPTSGRQETFKQDEESTYRFLQDQKKKNVWPLLPGDGAGRRWMVCLESEWEGMMEGVKYLRDTEGIHYEGFPVTPDRYIFLETVVEALADFVHTQVPEEYKRRLEALRQPGEGGGLGTPWDDNPEIYCPFHRQEEHRTNFCAIAIARKAALSTFSALKDGYCLPLNAD